MLDPRFKEVLEFIDELDGEGTPTTRAKIALKIQAYSQEVADLKNDLLILEEDVVELLATVAALDVAVEEQADIRLALVAKAQDAAVSAAMSSSGGARLRRIAEETRARIVEFERDLERDKARLAEAGISLEAKQRAIKDQRGGIVRRLNTMSSLAERAGLEFGKEMFEQPSQTQRPQQRPLQMNAPRVVRRRPRRVRVRRRRAS
ncbi:MAG: hypothetical protein IIB25_11800 [Chloroflexi bacterium]|nr:hypothetical protein [Chloroflexota bacterium]